MVPRKRSKREDFYWQRKLRTMACELAENQSQDGLMVRQIGFAEVRVAQPAPQTSQLCVEIGGVRLITDSSYPADRLAMLKLDGKRVYLACGRTDMRKRINGLAASVEGSFQLDPWSGAVTRNHDFWQEGFGLCGANMSGCNIPNWAYLLGG